MNSRDHRRQVLVAIGALAAVVGGLLAISGRGRLAPAASLAWGLGWLAVGRLGGAPLSVPVGVAAVLAVVLSVAVTVGARLRMAELPVSPPTRMVAA